MQKQESQVNREAALPTIRNLSKSQIAVFTLKIAVTVACFWYLLHHVDVAELRRTLPGLDARWTILAICLLIAQIPLVGAPLVPGRQDFRNARRAVDLPLDERGRGDRPIFRTDITGSCR